MPGIKNVKMSKLDRSLLYELDLNGRQSLNVLSKKLAVSRQSLNYRFERLIKLGLISSFTLIVNFGKLGYLNYEVWLRLRDVDIKKRKLFEDHLFSNQRINWACVCSGEFDYMFDILCENPLDFYDIFNNILDKFPDLIQNHFLTITREMRNYSRDYIIQRASNPKDRVSRILSSGLQEKVDINQYDVSILKELSANSRISILDICEKTRLSPNTVRAKIIRLEKMGVIGGYRVVLQSSLMGLEHYEIPISTQHLSSGKIKEIESWCITNSNCIFLFKTVGTWDFNFVLIVQSYEEAQEHLNQIRKILGSLIKEYRLVRVMRIIKYDYFTIPPKTIPHI
jgi:Lrp/AsnC family leucine-responsive transcriptional regulator